MLGLPVNLDEFTSLLPGETGVVIKVVVEQFQRVPGLSLL